MAISLDRIDRIQRARDLAGKLATVTEALNEALARAETALRGLSLGVTAMVPLIGSGDSCTHQLWWAKDGAEWMLRVTGPGGYSSPLRKASRQLRVAAAAALEPLVDRLCEAVVEQTAETEKALNAVEDSVEGLIR